MNDNMPTGGRDDASETSGVPGSATPGESSVGGGERPGPSRRRFFGTAAATAAAALAAGGVGGYAIKASNDRDATSSGAASSATASSAAEGTGAAKPGGATSTDRSALIVPFYGVKQAGITTAQQERMMFASLDVTSTDPKDLQFLLGRWAALAARFTAGKSVSSSPDDPAAPPLDTGEALDSGPYSLTITVGLGASLFDDRFGLAGQMPAALEPLGTIPGDAVLQPALTGGDLCIQACADDPQVVFHAVRNMVRAARGTAVLRWSQLGFGRASATGAGQTTPRNLMGFKDGTNNIHADDVPATSEHVWVGDETDQAWMKGGSYLVARKIRMEIESWDTDDLDDQEKIFGRTKVNGDPLSGGTEFTPIDFDKKAADGTPVIDVRSHVRLASPEANGGVRILRRGYNYTDGQDPETGKLAAGLFFISYQRNPHTQFKVLQSRLGASDLLNEYIAHVGGGIWACPPGVTAAGDWYAKSLFRAI
ncbi:deferrochelatase/peroxidase EfeB [Nakamurella panacisegetis]|uniref:Deferrochelatase n=1 Tax=Nakamurella panacisegetis TaxID=1090615 RepID=A0A1H0JED4_9ACTN|nr:iron uptake transporter deferrochelatase/peroxidase subunit [Nakamurella panacisegetis]SDO41721.1 deferrochelatase/peroxidase EfeB [Nakamurella panacisegetis]